MDQKNKERELPLLEKLFASREALQANFLKTFVWNDLILAQGFQIKFGFSVNQLSTEISAEEAKKVSKTYWGEEIYSEGWFGIKEREKDVNQTSWYLYDFELDGKAVNMIYRNTKLQSEFKVILHL